MNKIAWIGLGKMGLPMAKNLVKAGYPVIAYNRTIRQSYEGMTVTDSIEDAVSEADVVFLMVSDAAAVRSVLFGDGGALRHMRKGTLLVNMSTIGVDETKQLGLELADHGVELMDAPVSGSVGPAENGTLVVLAGGTQAAYEKVEPLFQAMSKKSFHLGSLGSGAAMKLLVNAFMGATMTAAAECMGIADKTELGRAAFLEVLEQTALWSPILAAKREAWVNEDYKAAFSLKHMTKDLGLMAAFCTQLSTSAPTVSASLNTYLAAQANGLADDDMATVAKHVRKQMGMS
jgi:3-hydroxyisobutyrate dehydrogenase-like beta-hydroxyacid dehydrogenase